MVLEQNNDHNIVFPQGYYKNMAAYEDTVTPDGWFKTGDEFHLDENDRLSYVVRKKITFKHMGSHVSVLNHHISVTASYLRHLVEIYSWSWQLEQRS